MKPLKANELPPDLTAALIADGLLAFFESCTPAHQQEYLQWIGETKRPTTRQNRVAKTVAMLRQKKEEASLKLGKNAH